jgi:hypothetical protein
MTGEIKEGTMAKIKIWMSSPSFPLYGTGLARPRRRPSMTGEIKESLGNRKPLLPR